MILKLRGRVAILWSSVSWWRRRLRRRREMRREMRGEMRKKTEWKQRRERKGH
jgi:hypothetical protein